MASNCVGGVPTFTYIRVLERPGDDLGLDAAVGRGHGRGRGRRAAVRAPEHLTLERAARGRERAGMRGQRGEAERRPGGVVVDEVHAEPAFTGNNRGLAGAASLPGEEEGEQKKHSRRFHARWRRRLASGVEEEAVSARVASV